MKGQKRPSARRTARAAVGCDCDGFGWLHMHDSQGRGPGIERCDTCCQYDDDDAAGQAHASSCPCDLLVLTEQVMRAKDYAEEICGALDLGDEEARYITAMLVDYATEEKTITDQGESR